MKKIIMLFVSVLILSSCVKIEQRNKPEIICLDGYKQRIFHTYGGIGYSPIFDPKTSKVIPCESL